MQDVKELAKRLGTGTRIAPVLDLQIAYALHRAGVITAGESSGPAPLDVRPLLEGQIGLEPLVESYGYKHTGIPG